MPEDLTAIKRLKVNMNDYSTLQQTIGNTSQSLKNGSINKMPEPSKSEIKTESGAGLGAKNGRGLMEKC